MIITINPSISQRDSQKMKRKDKKRDNTGITGNSETDQPIRQRDVVFSRTIHLDYQAGS